jgi:protein TonB
MIRALAVAATGHVLVIGLLIFLTMRIPMPLPLPPDIPASIDIIQGTGAAGSAATAPRQTPRPPAPPPKPAVAAPPPPPPLPVAAELPAPPPPSAAPRPSVAAPASPSPPPAVRLGGGNDVQPAEITEAAGRLRPAELGRGNPPPVYPPEAARLGEHGLVTLRIHVAADGSVAGVDVIRSSGSPLLDRAAADQVASVWHFRPAIRDGHPVPDMFDLNIDFTLD